MNRLQCALRFIFVGPLLAMVFPSAAASATNFEKLHRDLHWKVEREAREPPGTGTLDLHKEWMRRKAADRDKARALAAQAQNEGNPYWAEQFQEIAELAQEHANSSVRYATESWVYTTEDWRTAVDR